MVRSGVLACAPLRLALACKRVLGPDDDHHGLVEQGLRHQVERFIGQAQVGQAVTGRGLAANMCRAFPRPVVLGAVLLLFVANWPSPRRLAWRTLLRARAIENQCYVLAPAQWGCSRFFSWDCKVSTST